MRSLYCHSLAWKQLLVVALNYNFDRNTSKIEQIETEHVRKSARAVSLMIACFEMRVWSVGCVDGRI